MSIFFFGIHSLCRTKLSNAISSHVAYILKEEREKSAAFRLKCLPRNLEFRGKQSATLNRKFQSPSLDTLLRITSALGADLAKIIARAQKRASKKIPAIGKAVKVCVFNTRNTPILEVKCGLNSPITTWVNDINF